MPAPLSAQYPTAIGEFVGGGSVVGSLLFIGAGQLVAQNNTKLFWDNTNNWLGVGTNAPGSPVDVRHPASPAVDGVQVYNTGGGADGRASIALRSDVSTVRSWSIGIDTDGGTTKQFQIRDITGGVIRWRLDTSGNMFLPAYTTNSVLFVGPSGQISQDNTNLNWDDTANLLFANNIQSAFINAQNNSTTAGSMQIRNTNVSGPVDFYCVDSGGTVRFSWGYGNASYIDAARAGRGYIWRNTGVNFVIARTGIIDAFIQSDGKFGIGAGTSLTGLLEVNASTPDIYINGSSSALLRYAAVGVNAPTFTTRSTGTKIVLYPQLSASSGDYALGIETSTMWFSVPTTTGFWKWYGGTTQVMRLQGDGSLILGAAGITKPTSGAFNHEFTRDAAINFAVSAYGTGVQPTMTLYRGRGTAASTTAVLSGDVLGQWVWTGATGSGDTATGGAILRAVTTENWASGTNCGTRFELLNIPNGSGPAGRVQRLAIEHDGAWVMTNSSSAGNSLAGEVRLRNSSNKLQASMNAGGYFDVGTYAAALTTGSVLFANGSNQLAQDNATFFWDNTNKVLGIGLTTPDAGRRAHLRSSGSGAALSLDTSNAAGVGGCVFADNGTVHGGMGYTTSGGSQVANRLRAAFQGIDVDAVITVGSGASSRVAVLASVSAVAVGIHNTNPGFALDVGDSAVTTNAIALRAGSTASVSAASTGNFRFNESTNKFQVSLNGAAYVDIATSDLYVPQSRTLTAGAGLTGGGDLSANRTFDVGAGTGITVNADDVAVNQGFAFAWTGAHTWDLGTSPGDAISFLMTAPGVAGQRDSHRFVVRGASFDTGAHTTDWRQYVDITSNAGASKYVWESRIDAGSFTGRAYLDDAGTFSTSTVLASGTSGGTNILATNAFTGQTNGFPVISGRATGSYDTTATFLLVAGVWGEFAGSRSAGANDLAGVGVNGVASGAQQNVGVNGQANGTATINYGLAGTAYGGTTNYALFTDQGDVLLNNTSGTTTVQGATTVNNKITQKAHSNFSGSGSVQTTAAIQTTDATQTTLFSLTLPDTSDTWISVEVVARDTAGTERAIYGKIALVYREGGGATIQGSVQDIHSDVETSAGLDATITVSSNDVRVSVTGLAATTINWAATINYQTVSGSA